MYIHKEINKRTEGQTAVDTAERLCSKVVSASGLFFVVVLATEVGAKSLAELQAGLRQDTASCYVYLPYLLSFFVVPFPSLSLFERSSSPWMFRY